MDGFLIINKPELYTSMDVIRVVRKLTGVKKVGHAGTLDPLATGVLIVCVGKYTKKISEFMNMKKEYIAKINLSAFSTTDDAHGELIGVDINEIPNLSDIVKTLEKFVGIIDQVPPKYSALKINGVRAYKKAMQGEEFELKPRQVEIHSIELLSFNWPILEVKVQCSKGTYIRSLAKDIGQKLKVGGYISELKRTAIGTFNITQSVNINELININDNFLLKI